MLSVNGKPLLLNDKDSQNDIYVKRVNEALKLVRQKTGGNIYVDLTDYHRSSDPADKRRKEHGTITVPLTETVLRDGISEVWSYYTDIKTHGTEKKPWPKNVSIGDTRGFMGAGADLELLYFLVFISPSCKNIPSFKGLQNPNPNKKPASFELLLPEVEAANTVEMGKKHAMITNKIFNELDYESMKKLAKGSFNIPGVDNIQENQLRMALSTFATADNEAMEKFLADCNINPYVDLQCDVNTAIEKGMIDIDNRITPKWSYKREGKFVNGEEGVIMKLAKGLNEKEQRAKLYEYFQSNPIDYDELKNKLNPMAPKVSKSEVGKD